MKFELKHILNVIIVFQLISIIIFLSTRKQGKSTSRVLLAWLMASFVTLHLADILDHFVMFFYRHFPHLFYLDFPFIYLYPPIIYLFTLSLCNRKFSLNHKSLVHFVLFVGALVIILIRYYIHPTPVKQLLLASGPMDDPLFSQNEKNLLHLISVVQFGFYMIFSIFILRKTRKRWAREVLHVSAAPFSWLTGLIGGIVLWRLLIEVSRGCHLMGISVPSFLHILIPFFFLGMITLLFDPRRLLHDKPVWHTGYHLRGSYQKTSLPDYLQEEYMHKLLDYMQNHRPYLEPSLNLQDLARAISITPHNLSQVLNNRLKSNFYDFVHRYRIQEAVELLKNPRTNHQTILQIMHRCGFNSKSVFNRAFKKETGVTPSRFRQLFSKH